MHCLIENSMDMQLVRAPPNLQVYSTCINVDLSSVLSFFLRKVICITWTHFKSLLDVAGLQVSGLFGWKGESRNKN